MKRLAWTLQFHHSLRWSLRAAETGWDQTARSPLMNPNDTLNCAVWSAYGWPEEPSKTADDETILRRLLALNLERAGAG